MFEKRRKEEARGGEAELHDFVPLTCCTEVLGPHDDCYCFVPCAAYPHCTSLLLHFMDLLGSSGLR